MLNEKGFRKKTYSEIFNEIEQEAKARFGQKINTSERSVFGILFRIFAWALSVFWNIVEAVYYSAFPSSAVGISLDRLVKFKGMSRLLAAAAFGRIKIRGRPGATIEAGFRVTTVNAIVFETIQDVTIDYDGSGIVDIRALEKGSRGNVEAGSIIESVEVNRDVESVVNLEATYGGRERETDAELLKRFQELTQMGFSSSTESIEAALTEVPGVIDVIVKENTKRETSADGLPPKCVAPFVFGGTNEDVAQTIYEIKSGGIESYGSTIVEVTDSKGIVHLIGFTRPTTINVFVNIDLTTNSYFPTNGDEIVKMSIVNYIGGKDADGFEHKGLGLAENVVHAKIVAAVLSIQGVDDAIITISTDGMDFSSSNIAISSEQVAKTDFEKVVIL